MENILPCSPNGKLFWCLADAILLYSVQFSNSTFTTAAAGVAVASSSHHSGKQTDGLSLLAFKDGIVGDPMGAFSSWNGSLHYCRWRGVTCGRRHPERVTALNLSSLRLSGSVSPSITNLSFLRMIDLSDNLLHGIIPLQFGALTRLRLLNLSHNGLGGVIPSNFTRRSQLEVITLRKNNLIGEIPVALGSLKKLAILDLSRNNISGAIPPALGNLSSNLFRVLALDGNELTGGIPTVLGHLANLQFFGVAENKLSGTVPPSLYNLSNIDTFQVSVNQLSGTLPSDLGTTLPKLRRFLVFRNGFQGRIPNSLSNASLLQVFEIGSNLFKGTIPDNLGILKQLNRFHVANNTLEAREPKDWNFLTSLTNCTHLISLVFPLNELGGELPRTIANLSSGLEVLLLGANQIWGTIPTGMENLRGLTRLSMSINQFTGRIPKVFGNLNNLVRLQLNGNQLSGEIPTELGNLTLLSELNLAANNLVGGIPTTVGRWQKLQKLTISDNSLNGSMPEELFTLLNLLEANLSNNSLEGSIPSSIGHLIQLHYLNISVNRLSGYLPTTLGDCQRMEQLYLYSNSFGGTIPTSLGQLRGIEVLDLSHNNMTGKIPESLENFKFLQYLNLSFNNFTGEVPKNGVFANASAISVRGNKWICGGISALRLPACPSQVEKKRKGSHSPKLIVFVSLAAAVCLILFFCFITFHRRMRKSKGNTPISNCPATIHEKISYHDLVKATDGFSHNNLIGRGSFGSVYRGVLDGDKIIAVKVLNIQRRGALKTFKSECEALRNIRHRNLVKIISVCSSIDFGGNDFKALVFEFLPNGSLEKWLYLEPEMEMRILDFAQRLCIAADVASALDYLHNQSHSPIVHCDLKPSNVLLDCNMTAHVGDFGLARFVPKTSSQNLDNHSSTIGLKGSIGYVAPEYGLGSPVSVSGDVYSFGILLLELFTARRPIDNMFKEGLCLQKFVAMALPDQAMDIIDPRLIPKAIPVQNAHSFSGPSMERMMECFVSLMQIGLNCTKESPRERMSMGAVLKEIHQIQEAYLGAASSIPS
uniref:Receptor kinase-like protein Xa21 n=1 Tax=Anthurium amnicola TaxID=1678845 RepID=A0A1D1XYJ8_9ARAE